MEAESLVLASLLCQENNLEQVPSPLWAPISSAVQWGDTTNPQPLQLGHPRAPRLSSVGQWIIQYGFPGCSAFCNPWHPTYHEHTYYLLNYGPNY